MKNLAIRNPSPTTPRGFTLTELMVVIVIIVVLAAVSFMTMGKIRATADKATAIRNLSQLQIANISYSTERNGNCVPYVQNGADGQRLGFWYQNQEYLGYLIGEVLDSAGNPVKAVPPSMLDPKVYRARKSFYHSMAASFGMNDNGVGGQGGVPNAAPCHNLNRIPSPGQSMAFATATDVRVTYASRFNWKVEDSKTSDGAIAYRHIGKALVVFFDGHVGEMSKTDMKNIDDTRGGRNSPFWTSTAN